jgi:anti-sigma factor RsiW
MTTNDCSDGDIRDLLPMYAAGVLSATERELVAAHVANCSDCTAELELIETTRAAYPVPRIDTARIIAALPMRGRAAPRISVFRAQQWRIAAGISIIALGGISAAVLRSAMHDKPVPASTQPAAIVPAPVTAAVPVAPRQESSLAQQTRKPAPSSAGELSFGGGLSDLSDDQLKSLLREIDTLESAPSSEPEDHATPIVPTVVPPNDGGNHG